MLYTGDIHVCYIEYDCEDACTGLDNLYDRFVALRDLPVNHQILQSYADNVRLSSHPNAASMTNLIHSKPETPKFTKTKAALFEYGWPDAFRGDDFNRDIDDLQEKWEQEGREERNERRERERPHRGSCRH